VSVPLITIIGFAGHQKDCPICATEYLRTAMSNCADSLFGALSGTPPVRSRPVAFSVWWVPESSRTVDLVGWDGPGRGRSDANFKSDVALYGHVDPMETISNLAAAWASGRRGGALCVGQVASAGSGGLLELDPRWCIGSGRRRRGGGKGNQRRSLRPTSTPPDDSWLRLPLIDDGADSGS